MLAGVGCGLFADLAATTAMRGAVKTFTPVHDAARRDVRLAGWRKAVRAVIAAAGEDRSTGE